MRSLSPVRPLGAPQSEPPAAWPTQIESSGAAGDDAVAFPMQTREWYEACAASLAGRRGIRWFQASSGAGDGDPPAAMAALGRGGRLGLRWELLGLAEFFEPCDLVWSDAAALVPLVQRLHQDGHALHFNRIAADSPVLSAIRRVFAGRGMVLVRPVMPTPVITLDDGWADPLARFNAGRRSDFRRAMRHAEKLGNVTYDIVTPTHPAELEYRLDEAFAVEAASWKGEAGSALAVNPLRGPFYRNYAQRAMEAGILRLAFMRIDGRAVAMQIALEWQQRWWLLKIGYDAACAKASPGQLLMLHTLGEAARRGLRSYEFLGDPAPWTDVWTPHRRPCVKVLAYPASLPGLACLALDAGVIGRRKLALAWQAWRDGRAQSPGGTGPRAQWTLPTATPQRI